MNEEEKIRLVKTIRDHRVRKKRKKVMLSEMALKRVKEELNILSDNVSGASKKFREEKDETIKSLFENKSDVNAFFTLQKKDINFQNFLKESSQKKDELKDGVFEKKNVLEENQKDLWRAEKALIKLEEFIKMEFK